MHDSSTATVRSASAIPGRASGVYVDPNAPEFVEGWSMVQTLGEGAFGEVKLLISSDNGEAVALKMVDLIRHPEAENCVQKEVLIHKMLKHSNVLKFFGSRREGMMFYMFLEYAVGGELFDRIEPDRGMTPMLAKKFFRELINGVSYLHLKGVTHRDIKPENLLLDAHDTLKISDFGMATLFRHNGRERVLNRRCGTKPYMAPEVLSDEEYYAQPADLWSCGIVLVTLLAGELPWDEPSLQYREYNQWLKKDSSCFSMAPWTKINTTDLAFLRRLLHSTPSQRLTMEQIKDHAWYKADDPDISTARSFAAAPTAGVLPKDANGGSAAVPTSPPSKKLRSEACETADDSRSNGTTVVDSTASPLDSSDRDDESYNQRVYSASQPSAFSSFMSPPSAALELDTDMLCFSQPAKPDQMLLSQSSDGREGCPLQRLVRRMTRVLVTSNIQDTITHLNTIFGDLMYTTSQHSSNVLTVATVDRRGAPLVMKVSLFNMSGNVLVDFRLSKGCGLDFKREFVRIKNCLAKLNILLNGPVSWSQLGITTQE